MTSDSQRTDGVPAQELLEHIAACPTCRKANRRVNDFCEVGMALFLEWWPAPLSVEERVVSGDELRQLEQDVVNRPRTEN